MEHNIHGFKIGDVVTCDSQDLYVLSPSFEGIVEKGTPLKIMNIFGDGEFFNVMYGKRMVTIFNSLSIMTYYIDLMEGIAND